ALAARVFLFYTGYYQQASLPVAGGGELSKEQIVSWLTACANDSGHGLVAHFQDLWPYTNEYTAEDYDYLATHPELEGWEGDGNKETVFAVKFGTLVDWGDEYKLGYSNQYVLHFGMRSNNGQAGTFPFGAGWGAGPVNSELWNEWRQAEPTDIRRTGSIIDVENDLADYLYGQDSQMEETGYWQKKYMPITAYRDGTLLPS